MNSATFSSRPGASQLRGGLGGLLRPAGTAWAKPATSVPVATPNRAAKRRAWPLRAGLIALALVLFALAPTAAQTYTITTVAGTGAFGFSGDGGGGSRGPTQ